ncbi:Ribosomal RNA-processing protein 1 [Cyberlindnera fabianii]|uniref:Ribosomal RNA-processing protein 1 n=1 Tax=Cyberlindnera fabianii TaxID=36022 RepID=A0A1V2L2T6_CYBFA|nr:Ribosomal RNA-processing protein 1 [Cyberlindnera fabianii]
MSNIQTSAFVKKLAANGMSTSTRHLLTHGRRILTSPSDRPTRTAALASLKKFLSRPVELPLLENEKLWKGLFYSMWFCDRPRPQQRLAADLGELYLSIPSQNFSKFCLAFWIVMAREWMAIDHHRLDKFLLLVRRVVFFQLKRLREEEWNETLLQGFVEALKKCPLSGDAKVSTGIPFHLIDIYADELERMMFEEIQEDEEDEEDEEKRSEIVDRTPLDELIQPFVTLSKEALLKTLREKIKTDLLADERLKKWGIVEEESKKTFTESGDEEDEGEDEDDEESDSEEEWNGFA